MHLIAEITSWFFLKDVCSLDSKILLRQIEKKRADINELYENNVFLTDDKILLESRKLDELLNMFTSMQNGKLENC
jgi:hypothetical protein